MPLDDDDLKSLRERLDERRARRGGLGELIGRLLGIEAKLRQYELGKAFCDEIVARAALSALVGLWRSPDRSRAWPNSNSRSSGSNARISLSQAACNPYARAEYKHLFDLIELNILRSKEVRKHS